MRTVGSVRKTIGKAGTASLLVACALLCLAPAAFAAAPKRPKVTATVSACGGDSLTVSATLDPAGARSARGARLLVRFQALPLFRSGRSTGWIDLGAAKRVNRSQSFDDLAADLWVGVVRWRLVKGRRTVASGVRRSSTGRAGGRPGRYGCILPVGLLPSDVTAPAVFLTPNDGEWHRAPLTAHIVAVDDLSGVAEVYSSIDGGPAAGGRTVTLASEGVHSVQFGARDVAGNRSPGVSATVRVDGGPPSAPAVDFPPAVTGDSTPQVRWTASSDSGSGVRRYVVVVNAADGRLVATRDVAATGEPTQSVTLAEGLPAGDYEAQVFAFDGAVPEPFVSASGKHAFRVSDQPPQVGSSDPADGSVRPAARRGDSVVLTFDRTMDPSTVSSSTITLARSGGATGAYTVACSSPCLSAVIDPAGELDGQYTAAWSAGVKSEDGTPIQAGSATFHVTAFSADFASGCAGWSTTPAPNQWSCPSGTRAVVNPTRGTLLGGTRESETVGPAVPFVGDGNPMYLSFDSSFSTTNGGDSFSAGFSFDGGACTYPGTFSSGGTKTVSASAPASRSTVAACFRLSIVGAGSSESPAGSGLGIDDVVLDRTP